jgi:hypothetical protein
LVDFDRQELMQFGKEGRDAGVGTVDYNSKFTTERQSKGRAKSE